ncbi:MtrB/PioB family outer membrane beta-barrel protein [Kineobactrum salinum]|uniref:MtrB/PioB family outer membrane beta-barrel protein n=1 Tax=Kineobactrum salinum TaxID=2708301 RepID=UPI0022B2A94C|nr:MtrB/PioB family outer membrane beta-barrel protein [Kineobactrum salinum]
MRRHGLELEAGYRLPHRSKLSLNYAREKIQRENAATEATREDRYTLKYRLQPWQPLQARLELGWANRGADTYRWDQSWFARRDSALINITPDNQRFSNHPLLSQYHLANREQWRYKLSLNYLPAPRWNLNLNLQGREDDYDKSALGVTDSRFQSLQLSAAYSPGERLQLSIHAGLERQRSRQGSRAFRGGQEKNAFAVTPPLPQASDPGRDWWLDSRDDSLVLGGQLRWQPGERLELELDYQWIDTGSEQDFSPVAAADLNPASLPAVDTRLHQFDAGGIWHWREAVSLRLHYRYYRYQSSDWTWRDVQPDTMDKVLSFGQRNPNENLHYMGLSVLYRWH